MLLSHSFQMPSHASHTKAYELLEQPYEVYRYHFLDALHLLLLIFIPSFEQEHSLTRQVVLYSS